MSDEVHRGRMHEMDDLRPGGALVPLELEPATPLIVPTADDALGLLALLTSSEWEDDADER